MKQIHFLTRSLYKSFTTSNDKGIKAAEFLSNMLKDEDLMVKVVRNLSFNSIDKRLFKFGYRHLTFVDKVKATDVFFKESYFLDVVYKENIELLKNEEYFKDTNNLEYLIKLINYFIKLEEQIIKKDAIEKVFSNVTEYLLDKLQFNNSLHLDFILTCINLESSYCKINKIAIIQKNNSFYDLLSEHLLSHLERKSLRLVDLAKIIKSLDKVKYRNDKLNDFIINLILISDIRALDLMILVIMICNHGLLRSKRLNEVIEKLKDYDIMLLNKKTNDYQISAFFKILCYLHSNDEDNKILNDKLSSMISESSFYKLFDINFTKKEYSKYYHDLFFSFIYLINTKSMKKNEFSLKYIKSFIDLLNSNYDQSHVITRFHRDVLSTLIQMDIDYEVENIENYLSKDIVIKSRVTNHLKLCIELQGENHFYRDKTKNYQTEFKNKILALYNWKVLEIHHKDWVELKEENKVLFMKNLLNI